MRSLTALPLFCFAISAIPLRGPVPAFLYCKAFAPKIKEIFSQAERFFAKIFCPAQGQAQQGPQKGQRIRPKGPQGPQELGEGAEKEDRSPQRAQHHEAPELALGPAQQEKEQRPAHAQAVEAVQRPGEAGGPDPEGAQQIVQQPGGQPQQDGLPEYQELLCGAAPHPIRTGG